MIGDKKFDNEIGILKSNCIHDIINYKISNNDLKIKIIKLENQNNEKPIMIKNTINFTFEEDYKKNINFLNSIKKEDNDNYNKRYEVINHEEEKNKKSEVSNNINNISIEEVEKLYIIEDTVGDGNCLFYAFSQLIFGDDSYANIIREKVCEYNKNYNGNFIVNQEKYFKDMKKDKNYGGHIEISGFSFLCDIKLICYIREINDINSKDNENIKYYVYNEQKEGNFAIFMDYYRNNESLNHFSSCKCKNGIGISDKKLQEIKELFLKEEENNSSFENHEFINNVINNNEKEILNIEQQDKIGVKNDNSPELIKEEKISTIIPAKDNPNYDFDEETCYLNEFENLKGNDSFVDNELDLNFF